MKVVIIGGSGYLGRILAQRLAAAGHEVTATTRNEVSAGAPDADGVRWLQADALEPSTLDAALQGQEVLVDNVTPYRSGGIPRPNAAAIEADAHRHIVAAAARKGVDRRIFISVTAADRAEAVPHFHEKWKGEQIHLGSGALTRIVRPGMFVDQEDERFEKPARKGTLPWIGSAKTPLTFVQTDEVAQDLVQALSPGARFEGTVDVGTVGTAEDVAAYFARKMGRSVEVKPISLGAFKALTALPSLFSPGVRNLRAMMSFVASGAYVPDAHLNEQARARPAPARPTPVR